MPKCLSSPYILNPYYMCAFTTKAGAASLVAGQQVSPESQDVQKVSAKQAEAPAAAAKDSSQNNTSPGKKILNLRRRFAKTCKKTP